MGYKAAQSYNLSVEYYKQKCKKNRTSFSYFEEVDFKEVEELKCRAVNKRDAYKCK